jgi:hypothetical protein
MPENFDPPAAHHERPMGGAPQRARVAQEPIPMLDGAQTMSVSVEILKEHYDEILHVLETNEWDLDEGVRTVLLTGLGYQNGRLNLQQIEGLADRGQGAAVQRVDDIVRELAAYQSMYSVLKFKAYKLYRLNKVLEFNNSGLRAQEDMWLEWAERMRTENEAMRSEVIRLRALLSEFKLDWDKAGGPPLPRGVQAAIDHVEAPRQDEQVVQVVDEPEVRPGFWQRLKWLFRG